MTATVRLPRVLSQVIAAPDTQEVSGSDVAGAFADLFARQPGLRHHIVDETGAVRPHVSVFVDGRKADLHTVVGEHAEIRVIQAVSGG